MPKSCDPVTEALAGGVGRSGNGLSAAIVAAKPGEWTSFAIPVRCFAKLGIDMAKIGSPFVLASSGAAVIPVSGVRHDYVNLPMTVCGR